VTKERPCNKLLPGRSLFNRMEVYSVDFAEIEACITSQLLLPTPYAVLSWLNEINMIKWLM